VVDHTSICHTPCLPSVHNIHTHTYTDAQTDKQIDIHKMTLSSTLVLCYHSRSGYIQSPSVVIISVISTKDLFVYYALPTVAKLSQHAYCLKTQQAPPSTCALKPL